MRRHQLGFAGIAAVLISLCLFAAPVQAAERWESDAALLSEVVADRRAAGILAVERHVAALEAALKAAPALFSDPPTEGGATIIFTDGTAETTAALLAASQKHPGDIRAIYNPYPSMSYHLGFFYVEVRRMEDAVRVLNSGLVLSALPDALLGPVVPDLLSELGIALGGLKRWKEALAAYERALGIPRLPDQKRAVLHRGRGFALIEMGRLEEAAAAYQTSLEIEPGNKIALGELLYIRGLQAGMEPSNPVITVPNTQGGKTQKKN